MSQYEQSAQGRLPILASSESAKAEFQVWIDALGDAFRNDDFDYYLAHVSFPLSIKTDGAAMTVDDADSLRDSFEGWSAILATNKVDRTEHAIIDAVRHGDSGITCMFDTSFYAGDAQIMPTFRSLWEIRKSGDVWRGKAIVNGMKNITWPIRSPIFVPDKDGLA